MKRLLWWLPVLTTVALGHRVAGRGPAGRRLRATADDAARPDSPPGSRPGSGRTAITGARPVLVAAAPPPNPYPLPPNAGKPWMICAATYLGHGRVPNSPGNSPPSCAPRTA